MSLEEIDESLPNGFHDAELVGLEIDYVHQFAVFKTNVLLGLPDEPVEISDRHRLRTLRFSGVSFIVVDPPAADRHFCTRERFLLRIRTTRCAIDGLRRLAFYLNRHSVAPATFLSRQFAYFDVGLDVLFGIEYASGSSPFGPTDSDRNVRINDDVLHPLRFESVLGKYVDLVVVLYEPDFDLSRQTGFPAGGCDVRILFFEHEGIEGIRHKETFQSVARRETLPGMSFRTD
jgi:hypothetical protein